MDDYARLIKKADAIAERFHAGQKDKAGADYISHPRRVATRCKTNAAKIVVLLHDTLEDTEVTLSYLEEQGFSKEITDGVLSVTRQEGETYDDFITRASKNVIGKEVKIADLQDNMDITRLSHPLKERDFERLNKYLLAYKRLTLEI